MREWWKEALLQRTSKCIGELRLQQTIKTTLLVGDVELTDKDAHAQRGRDLVKQNRPENGLDHIHIR